jgi:hypothetical protein
MRGPTRIVWANRAPSSRQGDVRERTVVAVSACDLAFLTKQAVDELRAEHPQVRRHHNPHRS